jgi:heat shock protein HslJ
MKKTILFLAAIFTAFLSACSPTKNSDASKGLYETTWELEYISGPRIAFEGLFPEQKPQLTFTEKDKSVNGTTGCNGFGSTFTLDGKKIKIELPQAMTMRYCEGGGEGVFLKTIEKVNHFHIDKENKLNLMIDEVPMMRFKKVTP